MISLSPHELRRLLKRYGVEVEEVKSAERVEIHLADKVIVVDKPQVLVFKIAKQTVFQISGESVHEEQRKRSEQVEEIKVSEDDVKFIVEYTGVSYEKAREALIKAKGDIAKAIMMLTSGESKQ